MWDHALSVDTSDKPTPWRMKNISLREIHIIFFRIGKYCLMCLSPEISLKQKPTNAPPTHPNTDIGENFILGCMSWFQMQLSVPMKRTQRDFWATHPENEGRRWSRENWIDGPSRLGGDWQRSRSTQCNHLEPNEARKRSPWASGRKEALLLLGF